MIKIITINSELDSVKQLDFKSNVPKKGVPLFLTDFLHDDIIVRWGNSLPIYNNPDDYKLVEFPNVINLSHSIRVNCDKCAALKKLSKVVKTPKILGRNIKDGEKAVVRYFEHSHGKDFSIQTGPKYINSDLYATEFIDTDTEYRVWFCGEAVFAAKRVPLNKDDEKAFPCRSNWGYKYHDSIPKELKDQTLLAAETLKLEIGAADILYKDKEYIFLELNSAPSIDTGRLKSFFNRNIVKLAKKKFPNIKI